MKRDESERAKLNRRVLGRVRESYVIITRAPNRPNLRLRLV